jgi:phage-related protein
LQQTSPPKPLVWVGPARHELKDLPRQVQRTMGIALWFAQNGAAHPAAAPMQGGLAGVIEVRADSDRSTYRLMYLAKLGSVVYVLCAFQKKATSGIATPRPLLNRVAERLRQARKLHQNTESLP